MKFDNIDNLNPAIWRKWLTKNVAFLKCLTESVSYTDIIGLGEICPELRYRYPNEGQYSQISVQ